MVYKKLVVGVVVLFSTLSIIAQDQEGLLAHQDFFRAKEAEYKNWLQRANLSDFLKYDSLLIKESYLLMRLNSGYWEKLDQESRETNKADLKNVLFDKMKFIFDLKPEEVLLEINDKDKYGIRFADGEVVIEKFEFQGHVEATVDIAIEDLKLEGGKKFESTSKSMKTIRKMITKKLEAYFKDFETQSWFEDYHFVQHSNGKKLFVEVSNVKSVVITKESFFEHIEMTYEFETVDDVLQINYEMECKYGSGILWAPKSSGYYDAGAEYAHEVEKFDWRMQNLLKELLGDH